MTSVLMSIRQRDDLATTAELHQDGWGRGAIRTALNSGQIIRARQGWYAARDLDATLLRCVRVGGAATCCTGLAAHGCWTFADSRVHVRVPAHDARLRTPRDSRERLGESDDARVHWVAERRLSRPASIARMLCSPLACLTDAIACHDEEQLLALADSALHHRVVSSDAWSSFLRTVSPAASAVFSLASAARESGIESLLFARLSDALALRGLPLQSQVTVAGVGRVDFVVGSSLIIEVDGATYHLDRDRFESDRRRDARASSIGCRVLRFSFDQVVFRWPEVEAAVWAAVARGDHR